MVIVMYQFIELQETVTGVVLEDGTCMDSLLVDKFQLVGIFFVYRYIVSWVLFIGYGLQ